MNWIKTIAIASLGFYAIGFCGQAFIYAGYGLAFKAGVLISIPAIAGYIIGYIDGRKRDEN